MQILAIGLAAAVSAVAPSKLTPEACADLRPPVVEAAPGKRLPVVDDLLGLRDIGAAWLFEPSSRVFAVSPDKSRVAFQMRRADLARNEYCLGVYVLSLGPDRKLTEIDRGGEDIRHQVKGAGFAQSVPPGNAENLVPQWSPDGQALAFLRRDSGVTQVWSAPGGGGARAVTEEESDVETFTWSRDGKGLIYATRPGLAEAETRIEEEAKQGFLFDDRFVPVADNRPLVREPIPTKIYTVDLASGTRRVASPSEEEELDRAGHTPVVPAAQLAVAGLSSQMAWAASSDPQDVTAPLRLHVGIPGKTDVECLDPLCVGVSDALWTQDGRSAIFLRYEGWRKGQTGIYVWTPGGRVRHLLSTDDLLLGCNVVKDALLCAHESALQPRELVQLSVDTGRIESVFDPNPEFHHLQLGFVQRLKWRNSFNIEAYGDLVLPASHQPGQRHPMIVVQYQSRGFLRGGTGDEFPVQVLAAHGFAVLSVERPMTVGMSQRPKSWDEVNRLDRVDWADFRSVQSSLEAGVDAAVATGAVDPSRVGLTGLSNGASTAQFTILHDKLFSALALATCCEEPAAANTLQGPVYVQRMHDFGYPGLLEDDAAFWKDMSIRRNIDKVNLPILLQLSDNEYLSGLESYMALKAVGKPVEMYVFPNEFHIKWQPLHRKAAYTRAVDWFDYWLQDQVDADPAKRTQYQRWDALKASGSLSSSADR